MKASEFMGVVIFRIGEKVRRHEGIMRKVIYDQAETANLLRAQKTTSTDPGRLEREAARAELDQSIGWARGQADIWRSQPAHAEPARSYMSGHYTRLADAAERARG